MAPAVSLDDVTVIDAEPTLRSAAPVIAVSAICLGLGACLGFLPGFLATELRDDLGLSRVEVGFLVSLYFGCTGLGSILGGRITERLGARLVVALDMVLVAGAAVLSAAVGRYWALLVAAVVAGSAYALVNAGTNVAIGRGVAASRRTLAMSIKTAGVPLMAAISAAIGPWSASRWGWTPIWWVTACLAIVAMALALAVLDDDRPDRAQQRGERALPDGFIWFSIGAFLLIAGSQPLYSWIVPYLEQSLDSSAALAGGVSAVASLAGVVAMIVNALRADRISAARRVPLMVGLVAVNAAATALVLLGEPLGLGFAVVGTLIGVAVQLSAIGTMHAAIVDRAPHAVARATGLTMTGYYLGAFASPAAFGALADLTDTFVYSWAAVIALLVLSVLAWVKAGRIPLATDTGT